MPADFDAVFQALKPVFAGCVRKLSIKAERPGEYVLESKTPSPFPQHKGRPLFFGAIKTGKSYVSVHLMPLYMSPPLQKQIPAQLKKRMQGKSCFNFKSAPDAATVAQLKQLARSGLAEWKTIGWL